MSQTLAPAAILNLLKDQAAAILGPAFGTTPLQAFQTGSLGNFKYYWKDPANLLFNKDTYDWINTALKSGVTPLQQDQVFTNTFIDVFSKVQYTLSSADLTALTTAKSNTTDQQGAVLQAWTDAYGSLPTGTGQPIDLICTQIATTWATPPTTLQKIQGAINLKAVLNNIPASGETIAPIFAKWLNALGATTTLQNAVTMGNAYVAMALAAAQTATADNGGLKLNDNSIRPAFSVADQLADILNSLGNLNSAVPLSMTVSRSSSSEFTVTVKGSTSFTIPILDLLTINVGGNAHYFQSDIAKSENKTTVNMSFPGVTAVHFGPTAFSEATLKNWYWVAPIRDALANGQKDISGFKFAPEPPKNINFGQGGNFSTLKGVAISNYPTISVEVTSSDYRRIQTTFEQSASVGITFLGIPLGIGGSEGTYSNKVTVDTANSTVKIDLSPPPALVAGSSTQSVGWILGVAPDYPTA